MKTVVWTDGSCNANGIRGRGGWAALIEQAGTVREMSGSADGTTQHRMELTAVCEALETLSGAIEVRTDTPYVEKCFNDNWHERWLRDGSWKGSNGPVKNRDLWERLFGLVWDDGRRDVTFVRIRGHAGDPNNHRVDRLARAAALSAGRFTAPDSRKVTARARTEIAAKQVALEILSGKRRRISRPVRWFLFCSSIVIVPVLVAIAINIAIAVR